MAKKKITTKEVTEVRPIIDAVVPDEPVEEIKYFEVRLETEAAIGINGKMVKLSPGLHYVDERTFHVLQNAGRV